MLPFMQPKRRNETLMMDRKPDGSIEQSGEDTQALLSVAEDLMAALGIKGDASRVASALKAAFEICDSYEGEAL